MCKVKIEHQFYKSNNIKIVHEDLYKNPKIDYNFVHPDEDDNITDNYHSNIKYCYEYSNEHPDCYGEKYYIIKTFRTKNEIDELRRLMIQVQFVQTHTVITLPYSIFLSNKIYDPYYKSLYNGNCCYGNVKINEREYFPELAFWMSYMSRCFDPNDINYCNFGLVGLKPLFIEWTCFEYYLLYNRCRMNAGLLPILDPNDYILYFNSNFIHSTNGINEQVKRYINSYTLDENYGFFQMPRYIKDLPLADRFTTTLTERSKVGRPAGSTNKPKEKKLMYRVIKPNADLKYDQSLIV